MGWHWITLFTRHELLTSHTPIACMSMNTQVADLLARYERVIDAGSSNAKTLVPAFNTLRLADAALDKSTLATDKPEHALQIVVLGPTQAGKSTLCNVLLDTTSAGISALAGYTVHAQGFAINTDEAALAELEPIMRPLVKVDSTLINQQNLEQYVLESVSAGPGAMIDTGVIWDSPDFDSIESQGYRGAVLQAAALADVLILMVSKDKYADKTVWDMLALVRQLGKPLFVCINKLDEDDKATVTDSFKSRHQEMFGEPAPVIVSWPFVKSANKNDERIDEQAVDIPEVLRNELKQALDNTIQSVDRVAQRQQVISFVKQHWPVWIEPISIEQAALENWQLAVDQALKAAEERYVSRYLDNPHKYDTFNRAIAELLTLLEVPGIAGTLTAARTVVTWPARKLFGLGQQVISRQTAPADQEQEVLDLIFEQTMTGLQGHIIVTQQEKEDQANWWQALQKEMLEQKPALTDQFNSTAKQVQNEFEPRIDATAQQLYTQLQSQPALLNSLRAARVTTDAAAVVLAVKSGGLAAADLVIAPAMLSVTTLLTESVLGQYMERAKKQLKQEQLDEVRSRLFQAVLGQQLSDLSQSFNETEVMSSGEPVDLTLH